MTSIVFTDAEAMDAASILAFFSLSHVSFDPLFFNQVMGVDVDSKYGGSGFSFFGTMLVVEELGKCDPSISVLVDVQNTLVSQIFHRFASEEQRKQYLPRICKDTVSCCFTNILP